MEIGAVDEERDLVRGGHSTTGLTIGSTGQWTDYDAAASAATRSRFARDDSAGSKPPATRRDRFQSCCSLPCSNYQRRKNKQQNNVKQKLRDQVTITFEHYISHPRYLCSGWAGTLTLPALWAPVLRPTLYATNAQSPFSPECVVSASHLRRLGFILERFVQPIKATSRTFAPKSCSWPASLVYFSTSSRRR